MCPTLHRLIVHGSDFLQLCQNEKIAPGLLSESSIEHLNSMNRSVRLNLTRKSSPEVQNYDAFSYILCNGCPILDVS